MHFFLLRIHKKSANAPLNKCVLWWRLNYSCLCLRCRLNHSCTSLRCDDNLAIAVPEWSRPKPPYVGRGSDVVLMGKTPTAWKGGVDRMQPSSPITPSVTSLHKMLIGNDTSGRSADLLRLEMPNIVERVDKSWWFLLFYFRGIASYKCQLCCDNRWYMNDCFLSTYNVNAATLIGRHWICFKINLTNLVKFVDGSLLKAKRN